jgi:hypothetical protein
LAGNPSLICYKDIKSVTSFAALPDEFGLAILAVVPANGPQHLQAARRLTTLLHHGAHLKHHKKDFKDMLFWDTSKPLLHHGAHLQHTKKIFKNMQFWDTSRQRPLTLLLHHGAHQSSTITKEDFF